MQSMTLESVPFGGAWQAATTGTGVGAPSRLRLRPRLRRWLKKLRQYGRFSMELDLQGLLHLVVIVALAATLLVPPPVGTSSAASYAGASAQLASSSLGAMLAQRPSY